MLHTKFRGNWIAGSGEEVLLKGFYHIWAWWAWCQLRHVTNIMLSDFHFLVPESFHKKFGSDQQSNF